MFHVITSSTHRSYQDAVDQARQVPGLEAELIKTRGQVKAHQAQHEKDQEQLVFQDRARDEDARTIESLRGQIALLRDTVAQVAGALASGGDPRRAAHRTASAFVEHANLLGICGTTAQGTPVLAALRKLAAPRTVHLLLRNGQVLSAHFSSSDAKQAASRHGAGPGNWSSLLPEMDAAAGHTAWSIVCRPLDATRPWMTLGKEPSDVFVVLDAGGQPSSVHSTEETALLAAAPVGTHAAARPLIRVGVGTTPHPTTA